MSKERLEEIKDLLRLTNKENFVEDYYVLIKLFEYGHADWLIQQAERVEDNDQAIVDLNKHVEELEDENVDLEQQNKRYREFIETVSDNWLIAEKIKNEVEGIRIITPHHLFNWINKEANKLLEESK